MVFFPMRFPTLASGSQRSRDFVGERAEARLHDSPYSALRTVSCRFHDGVLIVNGRVPTYYLKQVAQTLLGDMPEVSEIQNRLDVSPGRR
jgi:hypothetical protein